MTAALAIDDLRITGLDGAALLRGVSLAVKPGHPLTILGETGSGKTLVVDAAMGTLAPELEASGRIAIDGVWTRAADRGARRQAWGRRLALLPQEPWLSLDPTMRARPQVSEAHALVRGLGAAAARRQAGSDLVELGIDRDMQMRFPHQLSGGMAQRVAIAATRAGGAGIVLADEPTKGLDAARRDDVVALLRSAVAQGGALLCITHDVVVARALGGTVAVMLNGTVIEHGPADLVLSAPSHNYTRALLAAEPAAWPAPRLHTHGAPVIAAENLTVSLGGRTLFAGLDIALAAGEWAAVTGPSGCGKSTLGDLLLGLRRPDCGHVWRQPGLAATQFGKLYQDPVSTFAPRRLLRNALQDVAVRHDVTWATVAALLDRVGVAPALLDRWPGAVSGGELQRIALVRALLPDPAFLFADEPTSRLDPITQRDTLQALHAITIDRGCAVLFVTHDPVVAAKMTERCLTLTEATFSGLSVKRPENDRAELTGMIRFDSRKRTG